MSRNQKTVDITNRRRLVASYNRMKMTQEDMVITLKQKGYDVNQSTVSRDLATLKAEWRIASQEDIEDVIIRESRGLDGLELEAYAMFTTAKKAQNIEECLKIIDRILKIGESRRKLLGLDRPERIDIKADHAGQVIVNLVRISCKDPIPDDILTRGNPWVSNANDTPGILNPDHIPKVTSKITEPEE